MSWAEQWMPDFLAAYAECGTITGACKRAGITYNAYHYHKRDPEFIAGMEGAKEAAFERLEEEARRRAIGYMVTKTLADGTTVEVPKHSDLLLLFLMKHQRPHVYNTKPVEPQGATSSEAKPRLLITRDIGPEEEPPEDE